MDNLLTDPHAEQATRQRARARARAVLAELTVPLGVLAIGVVVLILDGHELSWLAGVIAGGGAGVWLALRRGGRPVRRGDRLVPRGDRPGDRPRDRPRDRPADRPARRSVRRRRAAAAPRAEHRTVTTLEPLRSAGWHLLHAVRGLDTTFDHIAIGHGGVIVLQSMSPDGVVSMRGGEPIVERVASEGAEPRLERLRPRALTDASAFRHDVERVTGRRLWVQAVVVIWSEFPDGCVVDGRCVYIHGARLADWLARRPHQLDPAATDEVAALVATLIDCDGELPLSIAV
jgi:hypothetical protein